VIGLKSTQSGKLDDVYLIVLILDQSLAHLSITYLKAVEAKFHYAIWSQTGPKQVCDQLRTCLRPDSVMEFGFKAFVTLTPTSQQLLVAYVSAIHRRKALRERSIQA